MIQRKVAIAFMALFMMFGTVFATFPNESTVQAAKPYTSLENSINQVMTDNRMKSANSSVTVRKSSTGEIVYQYHADKGITSAAAVEILDQNYR